MERAETDDGTVVHLSTETERGIDGPFRAAYADASAASRYGWYCTVCESLAVAMDTMGRVECTQCGNYRKPTEWDAVAE